MGKVVVGLGVAGLVVSLYALHVEKSMAANPFYEPSCVTRWGSRAPVFHLHFPSFVFRKPEEEKTHSSVDLAEQDAQRLAQGGQYHL